MLSNNYNTKPKLSQFILFGFLLFTLDTHTHTHTCRAPETIQHCSILWHRIRLLHQILPILLRKFDPILQEILHKGDTLKRRAVIARIAKAANIVDQRIIKKIDLHGHPIRITNDKKKNILVINLQ